jgi:hypothetical protein
MYTYQIIYHDHNWDLIPNPKQRGSSINHHPNISYSDGLVDCSMSAHVVPNNIRILIRATKEKTLKQYLRLNKKIARTKKKTGRKIK